MSHPQSSSENAECKKLAQQFLRAATEAPDAASFASDFLPKMFSIATQSITDMIVSRLATSQPDSDPSLEPAEPWHGVSGTGTPAEGRGVTMPAGGLDGMPVETPTETSVETTTEPAEKRDFPFPIDDASRALFTNYDQARFQTHVKTLASKIGSTASIELAGKLIIYESVRLAGTLQMYLQSLGHRLEDRVAAFIRANIRELQDFIDEHEELNYKDHDFFSASALTRGYLLESHFGERSVESPAMMYLRIAAFLYGDQGIARVKETFLEMANHHYTPASPTIYNAGTKTPQCSSCFLLTAGDNLESIMEVSVIDVALISKLKGGVGVCLSQIRHGPINGAGMSSGVPPVLRIIDTTTGYADQGGKRRGATNVFLGIEHIDIKEFINATNNFSQSQTNRVVDANTTVWTHDLFFKRVEENGKWTVFCPSKSGLFGLYGQAFEKQYLEMEALAETREQEFQLIADQHSEVRKRFMESPHNETLRTQLTELLNQKRVAEKRRIEHRVYQAVDLMDHIANIQIKSGFPFIMHGDAINALSNQANIGSVNSSNLCTEITEVSSPDEIASCNLASVSLKKFAIGSFDLGEWRKFESWTHEAIVSHLAARRIFDFEGLGKATRKVVNNLNRIIDLNFYPIEDKTKPLNLRTRPCGIGVSGLADVYALINVRYTSQIALALNKAIFACMYYHALNASCQEAMETAPYPEFRTGSFVLERPVDQPTYCTPLSIEETALKTPGIVCERYTGSPLSNGFFQFDLWAARAGVLKASGRLDMRIYDRRDDTPMEPSVWLDPKGGTWDNLRQMVMEHGVRNSLLLTCMPTATSAQIMRNAESTEQHYAHLYQRTVNTGRYVVVNQHLVKDLESVGLWNEHTIEYLKGFEGSMRHFVRYVENNADLFPNPSPSLADICDKYETMFEISQKQILLMARQRAIYIDQSQSTNLFVFDPSVLKMTAIHMYAHKLGLKTGIYYLRQKNTTDSPAFDLSPRVLAYRRNIMGHSSIAEAPKEAPQKAAVPSAGPPALPSCTMEEGCMMCSA